jgi:hypothetical protein
MASADFDRENEALRVKQQAKTESAPAADPRANGSLMSALGNAGVQRLLHGVQRQEDGSGPIDEHVAGSIEAKRGSGQSLDEGARRDLEPALGANFEDVRVHTDAESDSLNRAVNAEAFTTGRDIFFRSGNYNPGSSDGRKLLAHELTHVVQQRSAPAQSDMTVSSPQDESEQEASHVADNLGSAGAANTTAAVAREMSPEEEELPAQAVAREEAMPEEEELPAQAVAREMSPEEEELPAQAIAREEAMPEEEELPAQAIAREEAVPEEEDLPAQATGSLEAATDYDDNR